MVHTINYRGQVITIQIDDKTSTFTYAKNGNDYKIDALLPTPSKALQRIYVDYNVSILDNIGGVINAYKSPTITLDQDAFTHYYNLTPDISSGQHSDRGAVNIAITKELGESAYPFNTVKDFALIQPIFYDLEIVGSTVTVTTIDTPVSGTSKFSINGELYTDTGVFENLVNGQYVMYVKNSIDEMPFIKSFTVNNEA